MADRRALLIEIKKDKDFPAQPINIIQIRGVEGPGIKLLTREVPLILITDYRSPATVLEPIYFDLIANLGPKVILSGDLNASHEEWHSRIIIDGGNILHDYLLTSSNAINPQTIQPIIQGSISVLAF